ncbi:hypothetical protein M758_UG188100 [Ceratodon purpureus]|nr:hypothetical protein M758_UG188100 [Ceratodon purpureus]
MRATSPCPKKSLQFRVWVNPSCKGGAPKISASLAWVLGEGFWDVVKGNVPFSSTFIVVWIFGVHCSSLILKRRQTLVLLSDTCLAQQNTLFVLLNLSTSDVICCAHKAIICVDGCPRTNSRFRVYSF